jgi:MFS family permease
VHLPPFGLYEVPSRMIEQRPSDARMAVIVLLICFLFNMLGRGVGDAYVTFLLPLEKDFGWTRSELASVYSIYMISNGLSAPFIGMLFDRRGPRFVYLLGLLSLGLGYLLAGNLSQLWQFHLCVGIAGGIGVGALGMVPSASLISRWFPHNTSTAIGIAYAGFGAGTLVIVPFAQYLNEVIGWRNAYYTLGGILIALVPLLLALPWSVIRAGRRLAPQAMAKTETPIRAAPEQIVGSPLLGAMKTTGFWALAQAFFFTSVVVYTVIVQIIPYLVSVGFSALEAASAFGIAGVLSVVGVSSAGRLADRFGARWTATLSFTCTSVGLCALLGLIYFPSQWLLMTFVVFFGIAQGARGPIVSGLCTKLFPRHGLATIYGAIYACMSLGAAAGAMISGLIYDFSGGYKASIIFSMMNVILAVSPFWYSKQLRQFER